MNRRTIYRMILTTVVMVVAIVGVSYLYFQYWLSTESKLVAEEARPSLQSVLRECVLTNVTGRYWENELLKQNKIISKFRSEVRVDFYREIIVHCELDTSRALLFFEIVEGDIVKLHANLIEFEGSARYSSLRKERREHFDGWSDELGTIATDLPN